IAGDGWNGDALRRFEAPGSEGDGVTLWTSRWLTEEDAKDMTYALERCLQARFPGETIADGAEGTRILSREDRIYRMKRSGNEVTLRIATPREDARLEGSPIKKRSVPPPPPHRKDK